MWYLCFFSACNSEGGMVCSKMFHSVQAVFMNMNLWKPFYKIVSPAAVFTTMLEHGFPHLEAKFKMLS
jgi:hypothetical protein